MTPIEAAVKAAQDANIIKWHPGDFEDSVMASDIAPIITAFLDAAAARQGICWMVAEAFTEAERPFAGGTILDDAGKAAILALKEAVNG